MDTNKSQASGPRAAALRIPEDVLVAGDMFSRNELSAMAGRGLVREAIGLCYVPAFFGWDAGTRARLAAFVCGRQLQRTDVLCRETAAWVHGLLPHTFTLQIATPSYRRPTEPAQGLALNFTQLPLCDDDVVQRQRVGVTSLLRTVCDCAALDPLPVATRVLTQALRLEDRYLSLEAIEERLAAYPPRAETARGLRLVRSFTQTRSSAA